MPLTFTYVVTATNMCRDMSLTCMFFAYLHVLSHVVNIYMCYYRLQILSCQRHVTWAGVSRHMLLNKGHVPCWAACVGTCLFFAYLNVSLHVANIYMCRFMLQTCVVTCPLVSSMCHDMPAFCLPTCVLHVANTYKSRFMLQTCVVTCPLVSDMPAFCLPTCVVTCGKHFICVIPGISG